MMNGKDVTGILMISAQPEDIDDVRKEIRPKLFYQPQQLGTKNRCGFEDSIQR